MYDAQQTRRAAKMLKDLGTPCLIHQPNYSLLDRWIEPDLLSALEEEGMGCIVFSPLAQGLLTDKYVKGIPEDSRAARDYTFLYREDVTEDVVTKVKKLNVIARERDQTLAQMAVSWVLRQPAVTSALIGASRVSHIEDAVNALKKLSFTRGELERIDEVLSK
jgi:L-glyceraldehyde 3-phosphate reductase